MKKDQGRFGLPDDEPRQIDLSTVSFAGIPFSIDHGGIQPAGYRNAESAVVVLLEGNWPRAAFCLINRNPDDRREDTGIARHLLRLVHSPLRWADDLSAFLEQAHGVADGDDLQLAVSECKATLMKRLREGELDAELWDLYSGRNAPFDSLVCRIDLLEARVANAGDVTLDTAFVDTELCVSVDPVQALQMCADTLGWIGEHELPLIKLTSSFDCHEVWVQQTVRTWFESHSPRYAEAEEMIAELTGRLATPELGTSPGSVHRLRARLTELFSLRQQELAQSGDA